MVFIIPTHALEDWNTLHGTDLSHRDLTDEQFKEIVDKYKGWTLDSVEDLVDQMNADGPYAPTPSSHYIRVIEKPKESFVIASVTRDDLEVHGFDASGVDDDTMRELASDMSSDYHEQLYHSSLEFFAKEIGVPTKEETEAKKKAFEIWEAHKDEATWVRMKNWNGKPVFDIDLDVEGYLFEGCGVEEENGKKVIEMTCATPDDYEVVIIDE